MVWTKTKEFFKSWGAQHFLHTATMYFESLLNQKRWSSVESLQQRSVKMINNAYSVVMNPDINPLRHLPKIVRFQLMTSLALMWSVVFAVWSGMVAFVGPSMLAHAVLLIGVYFTGDVFRRLSK